MLKPGCDVISFENNLILLIEKLHDQKSRQKVKYLENKKNFRGEIKAFYIIFKELSDVKNYLRTESEPLIILAKFLKSILLLLTGLQFDICYVIKTRFRFEIAEITRFLSNFRSYSFAL